MARLVQVDEFTPDQQRRFLGSDGRGQARIDLIPNEAREILAAMETAKANGEGATVYKGRLVDIASIKQAEVIVAQAELIASS